LDKKRQARQGAGDRFTINVKGEFNQQQHIRQADVFSGTLEKVNSDSEKVFIMIFFRQI